jgi:uncharacterized membrane protein
MEATSNVGQSERALSLLGGGALIVYSLMRSDAWHWAGLLAGAGLLYRGATGYCPAYGALGKSGAHEAIGGDGQLSRPVPGHGGLLVEKHVVINKTAEELYGFWHHLENLPRVMRHLQAVRETDATHSHWVASAPAGQRVERDAEIIGDEPDHLIAWRSLPGATVPNSGSVQFSPAAGGRGTQVRVLFEYEPPAGVLGAALFGEEPHRQVAEDMNRFKQLMETGEIATIEGQPHGRR